MVNDTTQKITKIVSQVLEKDETLCKPSTPLKDLGLGEFDLIELVMKLEDQFGVLIEDADMEKLNSIEAAVSYITAHKIQK